jgi:hypothetical protein
MQATNGASDQGAFKHKVVGSSPTRPTSRNTRKPAFQQAFLLSRHVQVPNRHMIIHVSSLRSARSDATLGRTCHAPPFSSSVLNTA